MASVSFDQEWQRKVASVRASSFWQQVGAPPEAAIEAETLPPHGREVALGAEWIVTAEGDLTANGPARLAVSDLVRSVHCRFGVLLRQAGTEGPRLRFCLGPQPGADRWGGAFQIAVAPGQITVRAATEVALLRASLYLSNYWALRRCPALPRGRRRVQPRVSLHLGADLWGGFCTTQAWIHGREQDDNFIELARIGINAMPLMALFEDYLIPPPGSPFAALAHPEARANRERLKLLARQAARAGVYPFLMAYNPKPAPDHPLFEAMPSARGAVQSGGAFRTLCTSDPATRQFIAASWASLFAEIPELGGLLAITGGEGFYHCFMRSERGAADCPRCSSRPGSIVVAELVNTVAVAIRRANPEARLVTWPYSANHWSGDRDQTDFIAGLDRDHVVFQTEVDKDSVDWRPAGYAKNIWDYSMSKVSISERCRRQRARCRQLRVPFSVKLEVNTSIECLSVPYLPAVENQRQIWENAIRLRPEAIHSRWLFDGACKAPAEELGFWAIWGRGSEFADLRQVVAALAERDFGRRAAPAVRRAWRHFSAAMRHHPQLDYYVGSYFVGVGQPLILDRSKASLQAGLDPAFFGLFYWLWEDTATDDDAAFSLQRPLFYDKPGFRALARRGPKQGQDVALDELQELAALWEAGARELRRAEAMVPSICRHRFRQELVLAQHLAGTWRSAAQVEEFLRLRDVVRDHSHQSWVRAGHHRENMRDLKRMRSLAQAELVLAQRELALVDGVDFLDLGLRLDMGTHDTPAILRAKIRQVEHVLNVELPQWRAELTRW